MGQEGFRPLRQGGDRPLSTELREATARLSRSYEVRKLGYEKAMAEMIEVAFSLGQRSTDKASTAKRRNYERPTPFGMMT